MSTVPDWLVASGLSMMRAMKLMFKGLSRAYASVGNTSKRLFPASLVSQNPLLAPVLFISTPFTTILSVKVVAITGQVDGKVM